MGSFLPLDVNLVCDLDPGLFFFLLKIFCQGELIVHGVNAYKCLTAKMFLLQVS